MLNKFKKVTITLAALSLTASLFAGCGNSKSGQSNNNNNASKEVPKVYIFQNIGKVQNSGKPGSNQEDLEAVKKYIMEKTGIEPVVIVPPKGSETEKLNIILASNDQLDVFWGNWSEFYAKGAIQPINEAVEKYGQNIKKVWPEDAWKGMTDKEGKIWGVPRNSPVTVYPVYLRTDWLEKVGMKMPTTIDELESVIKAFKEKDPAGNGQTIPFVGDLKGLKNSLAAGFMDIGYGNWIDSDGKVKPAELNPGFKDFVAKMAEWYKKGYLYKESFTSNRDRLTELLKQNKIAGLGYWYSLVTLQSPYLKQTVPTANYEAAKGLKGPKGLAETMANVSATGALIPKKSKNVENVIKLINWAHSDVENHIVVENGLEGKHWEYVDKSNHIIKAISETYVGEFDVSQGNMEAKYSFDDPIKKLHNSYLQKDIFEFDRAKKPGDFGMIYDTKGINEAVPNKGDIDRMLSEEITKFIMGARPMEEYDQFLQDLNKVGMDKLIDVLTKQYNEKMKK